MWDLECPDYWGAGVGSPEIIWIPRIAIFKNILTPRLFGTPRLLESREYTLFHKHQYYKHILSTFLKLENFEI